MKEKDGNLTQNIENIFTTEELIEFARKRRLEKIRIKGRVYYIKQGCASWFRSYMKKKQGGGEK